MNIPHSSSAEDDDFHAWRQMFSSTGGLRSDNQNRHVWPLKSNWLIMNNEQWTMNNYLVIIQLWSLSHTSKACLHLIHDKQDLLALRCNWDPHVSKARIRYSRSARKYYLINLWEISDPRTSWSPCLSPHRHKKSRCLPVLARHYTHQKEQKTGPPFAPEMQQPAVKGWLRHHLICIRHYSQLVVSQSSFLNVTKFISWRID